MRGKRNGAGRRWRHRAALVLSIFAAASSAAPLALGHAFAPSLLELSETTDGRISVLWRVSLLRPAGSAIEPQLPAQCRPDSETTRQIQGSGVSLRWSIRCDPGPLVGTEVGVSGLARSRTAALVRVRLADGREFSQLLQGDDERLVISEPPGWAAVFSRYVRLGFEHILSGLDHLLFVLGLTLLVVGVRRLLFTITAFTVGHSITLALAVLGWIQLPSQPVEVAIAFSIVVLAVDLARGDERRPGLLRRSPWLAAGAFGLLHGLGFAGALREVGLPQSEIPLALLSFNLGIEAGQVLFVAVVSIAMAIGGRAVGHGPFWLRPTTAYAIGSLAAYWCFERGAALLG